MKTVCTTNLQQEREKLDQLIENALIRGVSIAEDEAIQKQSRLIEQLMEQAEMTEKNNASPPSRG